MSPTPLIVTVIAVEGGGAAIGKGQEVVVDKLTNMGETAEERLHLRELGNDLFKGIGGVGLAAGVRVGYKRVGGVPGITRQAQRALDKVAPYRKLHASGVIEKEFTKIFPKTNLNEIRLHLEKVPKEELGKPDFGKYDDGMKWILKSEKGRTVNSIRIMKAKPNAKYATQRVDYVKVVHDGRVVGRNGMEITKENSLKLKPAEHPEAHIPLEEWLKWYNPFEKVKVEK